MAAGDFVLVMQFIGTVFVQVFYVLDVVHFGEFSLLQIFISILVLRVILWFIGRSFGISIYNELELANSAARTKISGFMADRRQNISSGGQAVSERYKNHRHKNRMKNREYLENRRSQR